MQDPLRKDKILFIHFIHVFCLFQIYQKLKTKMSLSGLVPCFLCKAFIYYEKRDKTKLLAHMNSEHNAFFGVDFLLAGCIMNDDERVAIVNVVKDREPQLSEPVTEADPDPDHNETLENDELVIDSADLVIDNDDEYNELNISALTPETTLQEVTALGVELEQEVSEDEGVSPPRMSTKAIIEFPCPECPMTFNLKIRLNRHLKLHDKKDLVKSELVESKKEAIRTIKTESTVIKQKQGPRVWTPANEADGVPCTQCGKRFKSRGPMLRHFEDIHQSGEFPCKGCNKMFTSKNKMSSHFSRHCNPLNPNSTISRKKTLG